MARQDNLKRYWMLGGLAVLIALVAFGWSLWRLERAADRLHQIELEFDIGAQDLLAVIGFDGMIHDFKNCVLRPDEPRYCDEAQENADVALVQLDRLAGLAGAAGFALDIIAIREAAEAYHGASDTVRAAHAEGRPVSEIDALVRYDDAPATQQLRATLDLTRDAMAARLQELLRALRMQSLAASGVLALMLVGFAVLVHSETRRSQDRERRLEGVFSALSGGLIGLDPQGRIMLANPTARAMLQLGEAGPPFVWPAHLELQHAEEDAQPIRGQQLIADTLDGPQLKGQVLLLHDTSRPEGDMYLRFASAAIEMRQGEISAILLIDDVTDQERNRQQIERNSRLDALAQLTGGMAHDFNNLMATILYAVELARRDTPSEKTQAMLQRALSAIGRGRELTSRLLTFARRQPGTSQSRPMSEILDGLRNLARPAIEENIELSFELDEADLKVFCDPSQLENALLNIVLNSRDAIRSSGVGHWIRVRARGVTSSDPRLLCLQIHDTDWPDQELRFIEITVTDNGPGMTADVRRRATDPFFSTKSSADSTGLGLAMVYGLARQSNGELRIYSDEGRGTTVCLTLPRGGDTDRREEPHQKAKVQPGAGETILLVEDEPDLLFTMSQLLTEQDYKVITAENGAVALQRIDEGAEFDILLSDVVMPGGVDGIELAHRVRDRFPDRGILLMSGYVSLSLKAHDQSEFIMLQKPCMPKELANALRKVADGLREAPTAGTGSMSGPGDSAVSDAVSDAVGDSADDAADGAPGYADDPVQGR